jgi:hypothetical protein
MYLRLEDLAKLERDLLAFLATPAEDAPPVTPASE